MLDISESAIVNYKRDRIPKAEELLRIARHFGVPMESLLGAEAEQIARERAAVVKAQATFQAQRGADPKSIARKLRALADELDPPGA